MSIPYTDAFRVRTVFGKRRKRISSPKSLFRSGVVARASIFQISSHYHFQYTNRLKYKIYITSIDVRDSMIKKLKLVSYITTQKSLFA